MDASDKLAKEGKDHRAHVAAAEAASATNKRQVLRGVDVREASARALCGLRTAARGSLDASRLARVELEVRLGMACVKHAEIGLSDAPRRAVPGIRGCGAVDLGQASFVPGVSLIRFREARGSIDDFVTRGIAASAETVESTFGTNDGDFQRIRLVCDPVTGACRAERKETVEQRDFGLPSAHYDVRFQAATEDPAAAAAMPQSVAHVWTWQRRKKRTSTTFRAPLGSQRGAWRIDATTVTCRSFGHPGLTTPQAQQIARWNDGPVPKDCPPPLSVTVTYELELEMLPDATARWLADNSLEPTQLELELAEALVAALAVVNPIERLDTRPNPTIMAPDFVKEAALLAVKRCAPGTSGVRFPGAMPIGFSRRKVLDVQRDSYFVAEKSDGERRFLVVVEFEAPGETRPSKCAALVDRKNHVECVRLSRAALGATPVGAVFDGEVVHNLASRTAVFLVFDVLHDGARSLMPFKFADRYFNSLLGPLAGALAVPCPPSVAGAASGAAQADDARQYDARFCEALADDAPAPASGSLEEKIAALEVVRLVPKRFVPPRRLQKDILDHVSSDGDCEGLVRWGSRVYYDGAARRHLSDGLVFVPNVPYVTGTDEKLMKWKWHDGLTVDLEVRGAGKGGDLSFLAVGDEGEGVDCSKHVQIGAHDAARLRADVQAAQAEKKKAVVAEIGLDAESGLWEYHGVRPDKEGGNHFDVFVSTLLLHAESPSQQELEYRLRFDDVARDDWNERTAHATRAATSDWLECFSKQHSRPFWWHRETDAKSWTRPPDLV